MVKVFNIIKILESFQTGNKGSTNTIIAMSPDQLDATLAAS